MTNITYFCDAIRDDKSVSSSSEEHNLETSSQAQPTIVAGGVLAMVEESAADSTSTVVSSNFKSFSFAELKTATRNFRPSAAFGCVASVFKGYIDEDTLTATKLGEGIAIVVKWLNQEGFQDHTEWSVQGMVNDFRKLCHPNLVKLFGYCLKNEKFLLVSEFIPRGSLDKYIFRTSCYPLSWSLRMKVALGAAKGLAYLHSSEMQVIHRDFMISSILLDSNYNAKLSYYKSHVCTRPTCDYAAPEYIATGELTAESDVYSFGVVLLEILCGRRNVDRNRPSGEHSLVEWAKPYLNHKHKVFRVLDSRLEGQYSLRSAQKAAKLTLQCLATEAELRPSMDKVVLELEQLQDFRETENTQNEENSIQATHSSNGPKQQIIKNKSRQSTQRKGSILSRSSCISTMCVM